MCTLHFLGSAPFSISHPSYTEIYVKLLQLIKAPEAIRFTLLETPIYLKLGQSQTFAGISDI